MGQRFQLVFLQTAPGYQIHSGRAMTAPTITVWHELSTKDLTPNLCLNEGLGPRQELRKIAVHT